MRPHENNIVWRLCLCDWVRSWKCEVCWCRMVFGPDQKSHIGHMKAVKQSVLAGTSKWSAKIAITGLSPKKESERPPNVYMYENKTPVCHLPIFSNPPFEIFIFWLNNLFFHFERNGLVFTFLLCLMCKPLQWFFVVYICCLFLATKKSSVWGDGT